MRLTRLKAVPSTGSEKGSQSRCSLRPESSHALRSASSTPVCHGSSAPPSNGVSAGGRARSCASLGSHAGGAVALTRRSSSTSVAFRPTASACRNERSGGSAGS